MTGRRSRSVWSARMTAPAFGSMPQIASTIASCSAAVGCVLNIAGTNSAKKPRKSVCAASR